MILATASAPGRTPAPSVGPRRRRSEQIGPEHEVLLDVLAEAPESRREQGIDTGGLGWQKALDSGMLEPAREGRIVEAKERLQACLPSSSE